MVIPGRTGIGAGKAITSKPSAPAGRLGKTLTPRAKPVTRKITYGRR